MKILITGGAGFIGSNLIKLLSKKRENEIIVIDNFSKGIKNYLKGYNIKIHKEVLRDTYITGNASKIKIINKSELFICGSIKAIKFGS